MSYNLKDFSANYKGNNQNQTRPNAEFADKQEVNLNNFSQEEKQQAEALLKQYQNMSNAELGQMLMREVANQKANGTFNKDKLLSMLESVRGLFPNTQQYEKLRATIEQL